MDEHEISDEDAKQIMWEIEEDLKTYDSFNLPDDPGEARKIINKVLGELATPINPISNTHTILAGIFVLIERV